MSEERSVEIVLSKFIDLATHEIDRLNRITEKNTETLTTLRMRTCGSADCGSAITESIEPVREDIRELKADVKDIPKNVRTEVNLAKANLDNRMIHQDEKAGIKRWAIRIVIGVITFAIVTVITVSYRSINSVLTQVNTTVKEVRKDLAKNIDQNNAWHRQQDLDISRIASEVEKTEHYIDELIKTQEEHHKVLYGPTIWPEKEKQAPEFE